MIKEAGLAMNELKERRDAAAKERDMRILKCGAAGVRREEKKENKKEGAR